MTWEAIVQSPRSRRMTDPAAPAAHAPPSLCSHASLKHSGLVVARTLPTSQRHLQAHGTKAHGTVHHRSHFHLVGSSKSFLGPPGAINQEQTHNIAWHHTSHHYLQVTHEQTRAPRHTAPDNQRQPRSLSRSPCGVRGTPQPPSRPPRRKAIAR